MKVKSTFICSNHDTVEFRSQQDKYHYSPCPQDSRCHLIEDLLDSIPKGAALESKQTHESWLLFKDSFLKA